MWELVGVRFNSFTDQKTGQVVEGYKCYFARAMSDSEGIETRQDYINMTKYQSFGIQLILGHKYFIGNDRYGRIDAIMDCTD